MIHAFSFTGKVSKLGNNIDTDAILPARFLSISTEKELGEHLLEDLEPELAKNAQVGDILVAGENFGCGSSREHAPLAIRGGGFSCVIAASFSRLFFRNSINIGLPVMVVPEAADIAPGTALTVDCINGVVREVDSKKEYACTPLSGFVLEILSNGGLIPYLEKNLLKK